MENNFIKITSVAYRTLDFFPDGDPLKNKAKEKVLAILDGLTLIFDNHGWVSLNKYLSPERENNVNQVLGDIGILENYLTVAKNQGWIDVMNFLIIIKEYKLIEDSLQKQFSISNTRFPVKSQISNPNEQGAENKKTLTEKLFPQEIILPSGVAENKNYTERQKRILRILKGREKTQVADIIKELPHVTKRTIRRDLDDLLKRGEITRVGEWNQVYYKIS